MDKILVVFTGGTICTTIDDGTMSPDPMAAAALIGLYKRSASRCKDAVELVPGKMFDILSENMTVGKWNLLIDYFQQILPALTGYSGIIIAHGTDTLAYSTALFSQLFKGINLPVIFVSSNYPILCQDGSANPKANGNANFRAAVECICEGLCPGVYATYENPEDCRMYLHRGAQLIQCRVYDDNFYSRDALDITDRANLPRAEKALPCGEMPILAMGKARLTDCILKVNPYVGLNYDMLNPAKAKAVLHGTYHSGTACVGNGDANSILYFFERCAAKNIPFYFAPALTGQGATVYASVPDIEKHEANGQKVRFHYGMTEELLYAKLLLGYSLGFSQNEIEELLKEE